jgi:hypothetical protein
MAKGGHIWTRIRIFAQIFMLLATVAFVYQNLNVRLCHSRVNCPDLRLANSITSFPARRRLELLRLANPKRQWAL